MIQAAWLSKSGWLSKFLLILFLLGLLFALKPYIFSSLIGAVGGSSSAEVGEEKSGGINFNWGLRKNSEDISALNNLLLNMNDSLDELKAEIDAHKREGDERMKRIERSIAGLDLADEEPSFEPPADPDLAGYERWERQERASRQVDLFDQVLESEVRDEVWATDMEQSMLVASQDDLYAGSTFSTPDCRSTFCRMEAYHDDEESRDEFENIRRQLNNSYHIQHFDEGDRLRSVIYFIRQGEEPENVIFQTLNEM